MPNGCRFRWGKNIIRFQLRYFTFICIGVRSDILYSWSCCWDKGDVTIIISVLVFVLGEI